MKTKRLLAAVLWFFTGWYAWNYLAAAVGLNAVIGPIAGILLASAITMLPSRSWAVPASPAPARVQPES